MWRILDSRVVPPRLFIKGRYIGGADAVVTLHEQGKLLQLLEGLPRDQSTSPPVRVTGVEECASYYIIIAMEVVKLVQMGVMMACQFSAHSAMRMGCLYAQCAAERCSSVPSAYVLWIMRELPPAVAVDSERQSNIVTFMSDTTVAMHNSQRWTSATSSQNQAELKVMREAAQWRRLQEQDLGVMRIPISKTFFGLNWCGFARKSEALCVPERIGVNFGLLLYSGCGTSGLGSRTWLRSEKAMAFVDDRNTYKALLNMKVIQ
ncbi:hypothetical protein IFM89_020109, partial [Coptis chinensis]